MKYAGKEIKCAMSGDHFCKADVWSSKSAKCIVWSRKYAIFSPPHGLEHELDCPPSSPPHTCIDVFASESPFGRSFSASSLTKPSLREVPYDSELTERYARKGRSPCLGTQLQPRPSNFTTLISAFRVSYLPSALYFCKEISFPLIISIIGNHLFFSRTLFWCKNCHPNILVVLCVFCMLVCNCIVLRGGCPPLYL